MSVESCIWNPSGQRNGLLQLSIITPQIQIHCFCQPLENGSGPICSLVGCQDVKLCSEDAEETMQKEKGFASDLVCLLDRLLWHV